MSERYAQVCVDNVYSELDKLFHYRIPNCLNPQVGMRCVVPFGKGNTPTTGYVLGFEPPGTVPGDNGESIELKEILALPDDFCVLSSDLIELALWMRDKYYTTLAACIRCITPSVKVGKPFSGTRAKKAKPAVTKPVGITLTDNQQQVVEQIKVASSGVFLLHGVTGSGKTEVYMHVIAHVLAAGQQAIVLVPEIALTPQMVRVFTERFGEQVAVTHSRLTVGERFHIWSQARLGAVSLVIGPRSAVFTPFEKLGLIVIDEEHEHTYHSEVSPKYDARAVAVKRGEQAGAAVVFGSATPGVESYLRTQGVGGYRLLQMPERINKTFPEVRVIDMRRELVRGNVSLFALDFAGVMKEELDAGRQVILFLNRRGYAAFVSCRMCGEVLACDRCRVNYTYHASTGAVLCHYCGGGMALPTACPVCGSAHLRRFGMGTQKVEDEVTRLFPGVGVLRMDMDTTKGKTGHADILGAFRRGAAQVLIGTQMVAKGLDFPNVTLVGVVAADLSLFTGDFRAGEHTFQLLTQVAGRAGRADYTGRVFIQTYNPGHYAVEFARLGRYEAFYAHEIQLRQSMLYPPFSFIFSVLFTGPSEKDVIAALQKLQAIMVYCNKKGRFELMGISPAFVSKIKHQFRWKLLVKCVEEEPLKQFVLYCIKKLRENDPNRQLAKITVQLSLNPPIME